jgi:hypothetical protein
VTDLKLTRRTPSSRLRYIATQLDKLKGASPKELAVLTAGVICLNDLADELDGKGLSLVDAMELHSLTGGVIDRAQRERWKAAGRCGVCGFDGGRTGCADCVAAPATQASEPCPTPCDPDCVAACHEGHQPRWKRSHEPADCVASRQASEPRSES